MGGVTAILPLMKAV